jgi:hypothetical protein
MRYAASRRYRSAASRWACSSTSVPIGVSLWRTLDECGSVSKRPSQVEVDESDGVAMKANTGRSRMSVSLCNGRQSYGQQAIQLGGLARPLIGPMQCGRGLRIESLLRLDQTVQRRTVASGDAGHAVPREKPHPSKKGHGGHIGCGDNDPDHPKEFQNGTT